MLMQLDHAPLLTGSPYVPTDVQGGGRGNGAAAAIPTYLVTFQYGDAPAESLVRISQPTAELALAQFNRDYKGLRPLSVALEIERRDW